MDSLKQFSTIHQVSQKLHIPKPTLRFWEKEFKGILVPLRTNGGQRRYAPEHVSIIEEIRILKKAGLSLIEIKRKMGRERTSEAESETCPQRSCLRGGRGSWNGRTDGIDLLAERVAEVVKMEVHRFFQRAEED